jgi:uncharacterized protein involved in exopolysaccharide biosynthesis
MTRAEPGTAEEAIATLEHALRIARRRRGWMFALALVGVGALAVFAILSIGLVVSG